MTPLQSIIGSVGNEDRGSRRRPLLHLTSGRIRTNQPGLYEVGQPRGTASFRNGIDDMLEQIGPKSASKICCLKAQLVRGNDRVFEEVHRCLRQKRIPEMIAAGVSGKAFDGVVEAIVPRACRRGAGWRNHLHGGAPPSRRASLLTAWGGVLASGTCC